MPTMAMTGQGWTQELGTQPRPPNVVVRTQLLGPSAAVYYRNCGSLGTQTQASDMGHGYHNHEAKHPLQLAWKSTPVDHYLLIFSSQLQKPSLTLHIWLFYVESCIIRLSVIELQKPYSGDLEGPMNFQQAVKFISFSVMNSSFFYYNLLWLFIITLG